MITQEFLKTILHYNPKTGKFTWIKTNKYSNQKPGDNAGHRHPNTGYVSITINRRFNSAHRLAWLYVYGKYPDGQIDHINQDRSDNRIKNLRDVSNAINCQNRTLRKNNTSGVSGVYFDKQSQKWEVRLRINKVTHYFGRYSEKDFAIKLRNEKAMELGFSELHGSP